MTVQREFAERMIAQPDNKDYSALSCFVQYYTTPKILFKIKNTSFRPVPKVDSCFIKMDLRKKVRLKAKDEELLFKVIHSGFQQRRKTILNSLSKALEKEKLRAILDSLKINSQWRAENLRLEDFVRISNAIRA